MIHLCAAVGAIENARQRIWLSVRLVNTPLRSPQPLNDIPCFFVNDLRVRVLEYKPVFGGGFPLLGFIVFRSRLVQDFPAHIFLFLEDVDDGGARPFIRVCIVRPAARPFADAFPMCVGGQYPLGGQFLRDFCDVLSRNIRRTAVAGLIQAELRVVQAGAGQHSDGTGHHTCLIGKNISEHVLRQNNIKLGRILN